MSLVESSGHMRTSTYTHTHTSRITCHTHTTAHCKESINLCASDRIPAPGEKYRKKISAKRLLVSTQQQQEHSLWSTYGLGLQDADGAVKRELIDLAESQVNIDFVVAWSLHRKTAQEHLDEMPPKPSNQTVVRANVSCFSLYGICRKQDLFPFVDDLARAFAKFTEQQKLPTGSLVRIKLNIAASSGSRDVLPQGFFFLGVLCKKPLSHVLVKAWGDGSSLPSDSESLRFSIFKPGAEAKEQRPAFLTSHKALYDLVGSCGCDTTAIKGLDVSVFKFRFTNKLWSVQQLTVTTVGFPSGFAINVGESGQQRPKVQVELPFGLKLPKATRAPRKKPQPQAQKRNTAQPKKVSELHIDHVDPHPDQLSGSDEGGRSDDASDCNNTVPSRRGESSENCESDSESAVSDSFADADGEQLVLPTPVAEAEAKSVKATVEEFKSDESKRAEATEAAKKRVGSSFFNRSVGFAEGSLATSNRSICYHCNLRIPKGFPRYTYFWNTRRPSRYMHGTCIVPFVQASVDSRKDQALEALKQIKDSEQDISLKLSAEQICTELLNL